jgi:hypothetical protein
MHGKGVNLTEEEKLIDPHYIQVLKRIEEYNIAYVEEQKRIEEEEKQKEEEQKREQERLNDPVYLESLRKEEEQRKCEEEEKYKMYRMELENFRNDVQHLEFIPISYLKYSDIKPSRSFYFHLNYFKPSKIKNRYYICKNRMDEFIKRGLDKKYAPSFTLEYIRKYS